MFKNAFACFPIKSNNIQELFSVNLLVIQKIVSILMHVLIQWAWTRVKWIFWTARWSLYARLSVNCLIYLNFFSGTISLKLKWTVLFSRCYFCLSVCHSVCLFLKFSHLRLLLTSVQIVFQQNRGSVLCIKRVKPFQMRGKNTNVQVRNDG